MNYELLIILFIILLFIVFFGLFYVNAEKFYNYSKNMRDNNPVLFKIIGSNEKFLNDKEKWVRHFKVFTALILGLLLAIAAPMLFIGP